MRKFADASCLLGKFDKSAIHQSVFMQEFAYASELVEKHGKSPNYQSFLMQQIAVSRETLGNITTLECLNLEGCFQVQVLRPQVGRQPSLEWGYI